VHLDLRLSWLFYVFFTLLHLYANYRGLKVLQLKTLNKETMLISLKQFLESETVPTIQELNGKESLFMGFEEDGSVQYYINIQNYFKRCTFYHVYFNFHYT